LAVALQAEDIREAVRSFASELVPFLLLIGTLLAAASWVQVSIGLRPLTAVRTRLAAIRSGEVQRLGKEFPDEVRPLAEEIDALLNERENAIEKAKGRAADLAHGFKTPLQVLNVEAERLKSKGESEIASEISSLTEAMRRHVDRELARARLSYSAKDAKAGVKAVIDRVVRVMQRTPQGQDLEWSLSVPQELNARIDADDLAEVLGNLIENAALHAKSSVSITARSQAGNIEIAVADDGPGIAEERQREILERGRRLDTRSDGAGLGLAIVTDVLDAWGGSLALANGNPGLIATVYLPVAKARTPLS
jgi:signal transduction histidine kinase